MLEVAVPVAPAEAGRERASAEDGRMLQTRLQSGSVSRFTVWKTSGIRRGEWDLLVWTGPCSDSEASLRVGGGAGENPLRVVKRRGNVGALALSKRVNAAAVPTQRIQTSRLRSHGRGKSMVMAQCGERN